MKKQLSGQNLLISPGVMHLNWLAKSNEWGPGFLVVNIIGNYCCTHLLLYAKMIKETENEETRLFFTFLSLVAF